MSPLSQVLRVIKGMLGGGGDELDRPDLLRRVADAVLTRRHHGARGESLFPPGLTVRVVVAQGSTGVVEILLRDPEFDRDVRATLLNELVGVQASSLPACRYEVCAGPRTQVTVDETAPPTLRLTIEGGDCDGQVVALPAGARELRLGRGDWHGDTQHVRNDVVVCREPRAVSRRAARLLITGATLELEVADQKESLAVRRPDGARLRPALSANGRVPVRPGDAIEFSDGKEVVVTLRLAEAAA